ncbi:hypothetical protein [Kitasatospora sp. NPDC087315]|uniref:hypothetical protein n=1 Tax=Kitasatospora sp. NPDC087315 TaxID=3364069 RepID=UPI0037F5F478
MASSRRSRLRAAAAFTAAVLVAGCSSSSGGSSPSPGGGSGSVSAGVAMLRQSLAAFEKPLGADDAGRALDSLSAALSSAAAQGVSQDTIGIELVNWELRRLSTPEGRQTYLANGAALSGHIVPAAGSSAPAAPTLGAGAAAYQDSPNPGAGLSFYFVNGILNNFDSATQGKQLLETTLTQKLGYPVHINLAFNASHASIALYTFGACGEAQRVTKNHPVPETEQLVKQVCTLGAGAMAATLVLTDVVKNDFRQTIVQRVADPDFASDPVNVKLIANVQQDLKQGNRVVLLSHSQGGLFLRNALPRIGTGLPVGALLVAPPYGTGDELNANGMRDVMFEHDWLLEEGVSQVNPTVTAADPQQVYDGSTLSTYLIHYLANYLYCGSASANQIGDRAREVVDYVNSVPASRGGPRPALPGTAPHGDGLPVQVEGCPAPQSGSGTPSESPTTGTPSESPSETPSGTPSESPSETPTAETPSGTPTGTEPTAAYYVFILNNVADPGNILIGTLQDVTGKRTCDFTDGGNCADQGGADVPLQYTAQLGPFPSRADAEAAYCANAASPHAGPGGSGTKVYIFGGSYWADNVSVSCPAPPSP